MNNEMNNEINMNELGTVDAVNRDYSKLPKAAIASIHVNGNKGKKADGQYTASAFIVMVKSAEQWTDCKGNVHQAGEWRPENEWLHLAGMKTPRRVYADGTCKGVEVKGVDKARAAKEAILKKWGVEVEKKATKAKGPTKAELESKIEELERQLALARAAA